MVVGTVLVKYLTTIKVSRENARWFSEATVQIKNDWTGILFQIVKFIHYAKFVRPQFVSTSFIIQSKKNEIMI